MTPGDFQIIADLIQSGNAIFSSRIVQGLLVHPRFPVNAIQQLANSPSPEIRAIAASSPKLPIEALNSLTRDNDPAVRRVATEELNRRQ